VAKPRGFGRYFSRADGDRFDESFVGMAQDLVERRRIGHVVQADFRHDAVPER
jgi:hypothetical protein